MFQIIPIQYIMLSLNVSLVLKWLFVILEALESLNNNNSNSILYLCTLVRSANQIYISSLVTAQLPPSYIRKHTSLQGNIINGISRSLIYTDTNG